MKSKSLKSLVIVATLLAGCSKESQKDETRSTTTATSTTPAANNSTPQQSVSDPGKKEESKNNEPETGVSPSPIPAARPKIEEYEKVNPQELLIDGETNVKRVEYGADNKLIDIQGVVKTFTVGGKPVELETNTLANEGGDAFILTKNIGKIKIVFNSDGSSSLWLTASQKRLVKEIGRNEVDPKVRPRSGQ